MKTVIISQARMTSTRLPGKILKSVLGKPLLEYQIERLLKVRSADAVVIATTQNETDLPVVRLCERLGVPYFRGSENDVLARFHSAAMANNADVVVRVTADCPLIDPLVIDQVISFFMKNYKQYDYVSNVLKRSYPRGMDTEVFTWAALNQAFSEATEPADREHVTAFIWRQPERFHLANVAYTIDASRYRWTVDTPEDFELIRRMLEVLYPANPSFKLEDALALLRMHPEWELINKEIEQKKYGQ